MKGRLIAVRKDGDFIKCEQDCTLNYDQEMLPTSSKVKGGWKDYIGGYKGWSVDVNSRVQIGASQGHTNKALERFINEQDAVYEIYLGSIDGASPEWYVKGLARLQTGNINAPVDGNSMHAQSFIGCGVLESWGEEFWRIINAMPAPADKPNIVDTSKW